MVLSLGPFGRFPRGRGVLEVPGLEHDPDMVRMIIICVDGATPSFARDFQVFAFSETSTFGKPALPLRSVYPSSTAPAHASMMTGVYPEKHGIVANRFWANSARSILALAKGDPIATIHPYEHDSLTAPSLVGSLLDKGLRIAAVQFPHAFCRSWRMDEVKSVYCVYHPSRTYAIPRGENGEWLVSFREMGFHIEVALRSPGHNLPPELCTAMDVRLRAEVQ